MSGKPAVIKFPSPNEEAALNHMPKSEPTVRSAAEDEDCKEILEKMRRLSRSDRDRVSRLLTRFYQRALGL